MSDIEKFLNGEAFLLFRDETLRDHACKAVEAFCEKNKTVDKNQLHPIPAAIQARQMSGFRKLVEQQRKKNTKKENKAFWNFLFNLVLNSTPDKDALNTLIKERLEAENLLEEGTGIKDRAEQNRIKRENKEKMNLAMEKVLPIYFEHFNCHYFYHVNREAPENE